MLDPTALPARATTTTTMMLCIAINSTPLRFHADLGDRPHSAFDGLDGHDVGGIAFVGGPKPGKVQFQLDDVRLQ